MAYTLKNISGWSHEIGFCVIISKYKLLNIVLTCEYSQNLRRDVLKSRRLENFIVLTNKIIFEEMYFE